MQKQTMFLGELADSLASVELYKKSMQSTSENIHKKLLQILPKVIEGELTQKQKKCLKMHYIENMSLTKISEKLSINKSTVSRHIKSAKAKIKKFLKYLI